MNEETPKSNVAVIVVPEGMIGLGKAVEDMVRARFGESFVAELTENDLKAAAAGDRTRTGAWQQARDQMLASLKSGELTAFAVQAARQICVPLPAGYWNEWIAEWRPFLSGRVEVQATIS